MSSCSTSPLRPRWRSGSSLYLALFAFILAGAALVVSPSVLEATLGHDVGLRDYASPATVGGALGAGLESDEAVREAAYASSKGAAGATGEP